MVLAQQKKRVKIKKFTEKIIPTLKKKKKKRSSETPIVKITRFSNIYFIFSLLLILLFIVTNVLFSN